MKYKVKILEQTCSACPSQWEGETQCGQDIYIKYRWGTLRLDINGQTKYKACIGDGLAGVMDDFKMREFLKDYLEF